MPVMLPTRPKARLLSILFMIAALCHAFPGEAQNLPPIFFQIGDSSATQGYYFLIPYSNSGPFIYDNPLLIMDSLGRTVFYRSFHHAANANPVIDFKLQKSGMMSYFNTNTEKSYLMDSTFTDVDSIGCANGYTTDQHDLQVSAGNHYLLFGKEARTMNLTAYHWFGINGTQPGSANAQVTAVVIQEFDENKNLVFEWKAHDHYLFGDVNPVYLFSPGKVDWTHANAVEFDNDGNILLSLRHFDEITKIDRSTGDIIWRFGGKQNQFTFLNDTIGFSGQHDIRRVDNTSVSMLDNGQYTNPPICRALTYSLDENSKTADLTWEYIYDSAMYSVACGSHQCISNGNHLADFGFNLTGFPFMVLTKPDKSSILELSSIDGYTSYRAYNYLTLPWQLHRPAIECRKTGETWYFEAEPGHPSYRWSTGDTTQSVPITGPGYYWVSVPYGSGVIFSEYLHVTDLTHPCIGTGTPEETGTGGETSLSCIPNPASGSTTMAFALTAPAEVTVTLRTLLGTTVSTPVHGYFPAGKHELPVDISGLPRGIYIVTMESGVRRAVSKLLVR